MKQIPASKWILAKAMAVHDCRNTRLMQNAEYWQKKRARNMARDVDMTEHLEKLGWIVIRIWECELKMDSKTSLMARFGFLTNGNDFYR